MQHPASWSRLLLAAGLVGWLALAGTDAARAQPFDAQQQARELVRQGNLHYQRGELEEALALYRRSHDLSPRPRTLFNVAQALRQLRRYDQALFVYRRYLDQWPDAPNRPQVEEIIADLSRRLGAAVRPPAPAGPPLLPGPTAAPGTPAPVLLVIPPTAGERLSSPWYRRWYVWTLVGAAVVGGVVGAVVATRPGSTAPVAPTGLAPDAHRFTFPQQ